MELVELDRDTNIMLMYALKVTINNFLVDQYELAKSKGRNEITSFYEQFANKDGFLIHNHLFRSYNQNERNFIVINFDNDTLGLNTPEYKQKTATFEIIVYSYANIDENSIIQQEVSATNCLKMLAVIERAIDYQINHLGFSKSVIRRVNKATQKELHNNPNDDNSVIQIAGTIDVKIEYNYNKLLETGETLETILNKINKYQFDTTRSN